MKETLVIAKIIIKAFEKGGKLLICGNGGSAAEAQHMAAELIGHYLQTRRPLPAIALTTDTSVLTALGNDDGFECVFLKQVQALGKKGDVLLTLSTSRKSRNVLGAEEVARINGLEVIPLPNKGKNTPEIQENHLKMIHEICGLVEEAFI